MFLHGFFIATEPACRAVRSAARALMTAGEGEFLGLSGDEATARLTDGTRLLEDIIGRPIGGLRRARLALRPGRARGAGGLLAMPIAEDHLRVWSPATGKQLARGPVITWASRTRVRLASSLAAAAVSAPSADPSAAGRRPSARHSPSGARPKHQKDVARSAAASARPQPIRICSARPVRTSRRTSPRACVSALADRPHPTSRTRPASHKGSTSRGRPRRSGRVWCCTIIPTNKWRPGPGPGCPASVENPRRGRSRFARYRPGPGLSSAPGFAADTACTAAAIRSHDSIANLSPVAGP